MQTETEKLDKLELAFKAGAIPALLDAIFYCQKKGIAVPLWVAQGMAFILVELFTNGGKALEKSISRYKKEYREYSRVCDFEELREQQNYDFSHKPKKGEKIDTRPFTGKSHKEALRVTAALRKKHFGDNVSADAIEKSITGLKRKIKSGRAKYFALLPETKKVLGLDSDGK